MVVYFCANDYWILCSLFRHQPRIGERTQQLVTRFLPPSLVKLPHIIHMDRHLNIKKIWMVTYTWILRCVSKGHLEDTLKLKFREMSIKRSPKKYVARVGGKKRGGWEVTTFVKNSKYIGLWVIKRKWGLEIPLSRVTHSLHHPKEIFSHDPPVITAALSHVIDFFVRRLKFPTLNSAFPLVFVTIV